MSKDVKRNSKKNSLITYSLPNSPITERYRSLRTNIEYSNKNKSPQTINITSASPFEGKSTLTANLAVTYTQQGKSVLLIDADFRKSDQSRIFNVDNIYGLSNVLEENDDISKCIKDIKEISGLFLMTSGMKPKHPIELLNSSSMRNLISLLAKNYDVILIDTPSVLMDTDSQIISTLCDATLLVVKSETTNRNDLIEAQRKLMRVEANLIGVIFNQVKEKDRSFHILKHWRK